MRTFVAVALLAAALQGQSPDAAAFLPPKAGLIVGIHWQRLLASPMGAALREQMRGNKLPSHPLMDGTLKLIEDIDSVVIAGSAPGAGKLKDPAFLVVVKGRFEAAQLRPLFQRGGPPEMYQGLEVWAPDKADPKAPRLALFDSQTLVFGERRQLTAALDRQRAQAIAGLPPRALELAAGNDFWMIMDTPPGLLAGGPPMASQMLAGVTRVESGTSFANGLSTRIHLLTQSDGAAKTLATSVQSMIQLALMSQAKDHPEAAQALNKVLVSSDGATVRLSLSLDPVELEKSLAAAKRPAQPVRQTIRIEGLDQGPVEVPVSRAR